MRRRDGSGGGGQTGRPSCGSSRDGRGGGRYYDGETIKTRKGRDPHNSDGILDSMVGGIIQETLRYRSYIRTMAGVDKLTQASDLSELDQSGKSSGWETPRKRTAAATATKGGRRRMVQR